MKVDTSFAMIAQRYRAVFFDAYGVLRNSSGIMDGVPEVLAHLQAGGMSVYVITNDASRSPELMAKNYVHPVLGEVLTTNRIISSGMLASEFLSAKVRTGCVAYLGKTNAAYYVEQAGLQAIPVAAVTRPEEIRALALLDDEGFDWFQDLNRSLNLLRHVNIPVIVANTDIAYPVKSGEVAVAVGSLANMIENIVGKTFIRFGKPDTQIFSFAYDRALAEAPDLKKRDILMVGDTLHTDILGANQFGIDTALVLSGNTQKEKARMQIRSSGIIPTFLFDSILT
jgi:HAD superfamily hydrolase (TIGR01450 family)